MRKDFCEFLLDAVPFLREYGNIAYKFSDTVVVEATGSDGEPTSPSTSMEMSNGSNRYSVKTREKQKPVASIHVLEIPD